MSGPLLALLLGSAATAAPSASELARARHALDRLAYGPRPGEAAAVAARGVDAWVEEQLHPERIPDAAFEARLAAYPDLALGSLQLMRRRPKLGRARLFGVFGRPSPPYAGGSDLPAAKLLRATLSERQLEAVLTDFWLNHFNVSREKQRVWFFAGPFERDAIRPRVFGRFRDLLGAAAKHPAMSTYLDNALSTVDERYAPPAEAEAFRRKAAALAADPEAFEASGAAGELRRLGLNENFGRELLELHTMGADSGYTQADVIALSRVFTGWGRGLDGAGDRRDWTFRFREWLHDPWPKDFLGERYAQGGQAEGEAALDRLARRPETARFLALKLARRFVADDPPEALVRRVAARFTQTDGDLREAYRALFTAPEFWEPRWRRAKLKTPLEFEAGALRAVGAPVADPAAAAAEVAAMGMPLYACADAAGWPERAEAWLGPGALGARLRAARSAAAQRGAVAGCLDGDVGPETAAVLAAERDARRAAALCLSSPEFQRR